jgi:hypothetical protein
MKKFILIALLVLAIPVLSFADNSRAIGGGAEAFNAIVDASSGTAAEVTSSGAITTTGRATAVTLKQGDGLIYTGACRIQTITVTGVSTGDNAQIYDALTVTGTCKFDIKVGTANDTVVINAAGTPFATGIYTDSTDTDVQVTVVYDY